MVEYNFWKREKNLKNTKEIVVKFERKLNTEIRKQEKLDRVEKKDFK